MYNVKRMMYNLLAYLSQFLRQEQSIVNTHTHKNDENERIDILAIVILGYRICNIPNFIILSI